MTSIPEIPLGPVMADVAGLSLTDDDRRRLRQPLIGGVILFGRNYAAPEQLAALTAEIRALRSPPLTIAIDHEGGRVQRCRDGFTRLPPMRRLGEWWDRDPDAAIAAARAVGAVLADELRQLGVDLSFTPVLDLDYGRSGVIGDRAFHRRPEAVIALAGALMAGLNAAGMAAVGKHFPGHGHAEADSHVAIPVDGRSLVEMADDLAPYRALSLDGVMPAHVIYPQVDSRPAGFSPIWIGTLRDEFAFRGVIFSDDLSMQGAAVAGDIVARAAAAWAAGCDMLLVCNAPDRVDDLIARWSPPPHPRPGREQRVAGLLRYRDGAAPAPELLAAGRDCCARLAWAPAP